MPSIIDYFITPKCYQKFFDEHDFEAECVKIVVSKLIGYVIILGSALVKVPQILKIFRAGSAEGISPIGVILELVACSGALAYSFAKAFPFSSYGESTFMTFQQAIIMFLVLLYGSGGTWAVMGTALYSAVLAYLLSPAASMTLLVSLQASVVVLIIISRLIQAVSNYRNQSTGQLSLVTTLSQFLGAIARILTSLQETGDLMMILTFVISTLTNGFLLLQIFLYWGPSTQVETDEGQCSQPQPGQAKQKKSN